MLMAAMLAMVLAVAAPVMAQTATQNVDNVAVGGGNITADISYSECVAIVSQGGNASAAANVLQSSTATNAQAISVQFDEDTAEVSQRCVDIVDSFNVTKLFVGRFGIL
jgi:hypothetical protein